MANDGHGIGWMWCTMPIRTASRRSAAEHLAVSNYIIKAFNKRKPYAEFVREQVAGDSLEPDNPKSLAATGFLPPVPGIRARFNPVRWTRPIIGCAVFWIAMISFRCMTTFVSCTFIVRAATIISSTQSAKRLLRSAGVFAGIDKASREYDAEPAVSAKAHSASGPAGHIPASPRCEGSNAF